MRVDTEPLDLFLQLMRDNKPCPSCSSLRVTVRRELAARGEVLRCECADCHRKRELKVDVES
jgi:transposase-like protein